MELKLNLRRHQGSHRVILPKLSSISSRYLAPCSWPLLPSSSLQSTSGGRDFFFLIPRTHTHTHRVFQEFIRRVVRFYPFVVIEILFYQSRLLCRLVQYYLPPFQTFQLQRDESYLSQKPIIAISHVVAVVHTVAFIRHHRRFPHLISIERRPFVFVSTS